MTLFGWRVSTASVVVAVIAGMGGLSSQQMAAQGSQAYLSIGAGATDLSGGVDWLLPATPVWVGGEAGLGNLFWSSLTASYHPLARRPGQIVDPFLRLSVTEVGSSPYRASGMSAGGGLTWWLGRRVGVRTEAVKFWPTFHENASSSDPAFTPRLWATRVGIAVRW